MKSIKNIISIIMKHSATIMSAVIMMITIAECNQTCVYIMYQPKLSKDIKEKVNKK